MPPAFNLSPDDYKGWTEGIAQAGYATGSDYAGKLQKIIEQNGLQEYDRQVMQEMKEQGRCFGLEENPLGESERYGLFLSGRKEGFPFRHHPVRCGEPILRQRRESTQGNGYPVQ